MTNFPRAQVCADTNYPFLTSKERDIETGLDYFLARYYSSTQGRFTSTDEFTGGPDELYYFADDAASNPTFYADLRKPQSLNKYQYAFNNPLRYVDPDGHEAEEPEPPQDPVLVPGRRLPPLVIPGKPAKGPTDQQIADTVQKVWELPDPYLYPISQTIGTAPDPSIPAIPIQDVTVVGPAPLPQALPQPAPPPAPVQAHRKKKQSTGKNKDHKKDTERPGRRQPPNYRPFRRPPPKPKPEPKEPKPKPKPKPEIGPDGLPVKP